MHRVGNSKLQVDTLGCLTVNRCMNEKSGFRLHQIHENFVSEIAKEYNFRATSPGFHLRGGFT